MKRAICLVLLLASCVRTRPLDNPTGPVGKGQGAKAEDTVLGQYFMGLSQDPGSKRLVRPCLDRHAGLADQSVCVMRVLDKAFAEAADCNDSLGFLTARMVARQFLCEPAAAEPQRKVFISVVEALERSVGVVGRRCPKERSWLSFTADVGSVLGYAELYHPDRKKVTEVARKWKVSVLPATDRVIAQTCARAP